MSELIDRQAAIDASCTCHGGVHCNHYPCKDVQAIMDLPTIGREWLHEYLQTAVDFGIITETQASRLMDMIDDSEDNT